MVKKPRANRSAPPRKPVIIEAEAQPIQKETSASSKPMDSASNKPTEAKPTATTPSTATPSAATIALKSDASKPDTSQSDMPKASSEGLGRAEANAAKVENPDSKSQALTKAAAVSPPTKPNTPTNTAPSTPAPQNSKDGKASGNKSTGSNGNNGSGGAVKGGVIGAILTLLGAVGLNYAGILPGGNTSSSPADLSALEAKIEALSTSTAIAPDTGSIQPLIDAALANQAQQFEAQISDLREQMADSDSASTNVDFSNIDTRISSLETEITDLKTALSAGSAGESEGLSVISGRIETIEQGLKATQDSIGTMGKSLSETIALANSNDISQTVESLKTSITNNADKLGTISTALETAKSETDQAIEALSANVTEQITSLTSKVEAIGAQATDTSRQNEVASAIATAGLKAAIDRGGPFMAELETFAQVAPDSELIGQLRPLAAKGVPTRAALLERFDTVAYDMINAENTAQQNNSEGGIMSGLMSSVQSLVKVRPIGNVEGDSTAAITARMGEQLKAGNLAAVQAEYATLPEAAKTAGAAYMTDIEAREQADGLIRTMLGQAFSATQPATQPAAQPAAQ